MKTKFDLADFKENELTLTHKKAIIGGNASEEESETNSEGGIEIAPGYGYGRGCC